MAGATFRVVLPSFRFMKKLSILAFLSFPLGLPAEWPTEKVVFSQGAIDILIDYSVPADEWEIIVKDTYGTGSWYPPEEVIFLGNPESEHAVPGSSQWSFMGDPGDPVWILGDLDDVLDPHVGADDIPQGTFTGEPGKEIEFTLQEIDGPGNFFLYRFPGGQFTLHIDTRPEEGPYGFLPLGAGGHTHPFSAFTQRGIYFLTFTASSTRTADGQPTISDPHDFLFLIDPLPVHWWLLEHFDRDANQPVASLAADPDGDGIPNLLEYAFALDPLGSSREGLPTTAIEEFESQMYLTISYRRPEDRTDLLYRVEVSSDLDGWTELDQELLTIRIEPGDDGIDVVTVRDTEPVDSSNRRFLRVVVEYVGS